jgi:hypothetical protein
MIETFSHLLRDDELVQEMVVVERPNGDFVTRLKVIRGDDFLDVTINHGPNPMFASKIPPLFMAPQGAETVGFMREMSDAHRRDLRYYRMAVEQIEASTLISDVVRQEEEALSVIKNESTFGPHITKQRDGHNHEQVVRDFMDKRAERTGKRQYGP